MALQQDTAAPKQFAALGGGREGCRAWPPQQRSWRVADKARRRSCVRCAELQVVQRAHCAQAFAAAGSRIRGRGRARPTAQPSMPSVKET